MAEDLVQEAFLQVHLAASRFDRSRRFTGLFQLRDMRWKLTELYVHTDANPMPRLAEAR